MNRLLIGTVAILVSGCVHSRDWISSGVMSSRTYRELSAQGVRVVWMDEQIHDDYAELDIGESNEVHFLRLATLRVFRSGAVERFFYDEKCDQEVWISDR